MHDLSSLRFGDNRLPSRFWAKACAEPNTGCWLWMAAASRGYGVLVGADGRYLAHRLAYSRLVTPIDDPAVFVLHRCDTPACVNPEHLFLGTQLDNMRDMAAKGRNMANHNMARKTHCIRGHPLTGSTVRITKVGNRHCRTCFNEYQRDWRAARAKS